MKELIRLLPVPVVVWIVFSVFPRSTDVSSIAHKFKWFRSQLRKLTFIDRTGGGQSNAQVRCPGRVGVGIGSSTKGLLWPRQ